MGMGHARHAARILLGITALLAGCDEAPRVDPDYSELIDLTSNI